jgi:hypothetical protein
MFDLLVGVAVIVTGIGTAGLFVLACLDRYQNPRKS